MLQTLPDIVDEEHGILLQYQNIALSKAMLQQHINVCICVLYVPARFVLYHTQIGVLGQKVTNNIMLYAIVFHCCWRKTSPISPETERNDIISIIPMCLLL